MFGVDNLPITKSQLPGRDNQIFCHDFVECIVLLMLNSSPGPQAAKYLKNINGPPPFLTVGMRCFYLYAFHVSSKYFDGMYGLSFKFWSYQTIALTSRHNYNEVLLNMLGCLECAQ